MSDNPFTTSAVAIVYDGECPFCSQYTRLLKLREQHGGVHLIDARTDHPLVRQIKAAGVDLNEGMVLVMNGRLYHGDECIHRLAMMSTRSSLFNRINASIFRHERLARALYPILRSGRNATLRILGRSKIRML